MNYRLTNSWRYFFGGLRLWTSDYAWSCPTELMVPVTSEFDAIINALPGIVWTSDLKARDLKLSEEWLRSTGLEPEALRERKWLSYVSEADLVGGALLWRPLATNGGAVSVAQFGIKTPARKEIRVRVLAAPSVARRGHPIRYVGTMFIDRGKPSDGEHDATVLLQRIADLCGCHGPQPTTVAPVSGAVRIEAVMGRADERRTASLRHIALFLDCDLRSARDLQLLFNIVDWQTVIARTVSNLLAQLVTVIVITDPTSLFNAGLSSIVNDAKVVYLQKDNAVKQISTNVGYHILNQPLDVAAAEELIIALTPFE